MKITEFLDVYKDCFPVGKGWRPLVTKLVKDIAAIDEDVVVDQVKEKFGGLRFYFSGGNEEVDRLVDVAESESYEICERCGTKEDVETKGWWILTLCGACREKGRKDVDA